MENVTVLDVELAEEISVKSAVNTIIAAEGTIDVRWHMNNGKCRKQEFARIAQQLSPTLSRYQAMQ